MLAREPEDGQRAARDRERLDDEQEHRARPDPEQRREQDEERIDVEAEPVALMPVQRRRLEEVPVQRVPDRLHHVPEVEPRLLEHDVVHDGGEDEQHRVRRNSRVDDAQRDGGFAAHRLACALATPASRALETRTSSSRLSAVSLTCRSRPSGGRSAQHVAHVRATSSARLRLLLVVAGQHLADQPERQELDADDDEQHAEQEQRPVADPRASDLDRR